MQEERQSLEKRQEEMEETLLSISIAELSLQQVVVVVVEMPKTELLEVQEAVEDVLVLPLEVQERLGKEMMAALDLVEVFKVQEAVEERAR